MTHDVFISYSSKNKTTADAICHILEEHEIKCWIAPRDIVGGEKYGNVIESAIKTCKVFVIIFSEESRISPWVESELNLAFTDRRTIVPFKIDSSLLEGEMRLILNNKHWIEAYPNPELKFKDLIEAVSRSIGKPTLNETDKRNQEVQKQFLEEREQLEIEKEKLRQEQLQNSRVQKDTFKGKKIHVRKTNYDKENKRIQTFHASPNSIPIIVRYVCDILKHEHYEVHSDTLSSGCSYISITKSGMFAQMSIPYTSDTFALQVSIIPNGSESFTAVAEVGVRGKQILLPMVGNELMKVLTMPAIWERIQQSKLDEHVLDLIQQSVDKNRGSSNTMFCPNCGHKVNEGDKFCGGCGGKM